MRSKVEELSERIGDGEAGPIVAADILYELGQGADKPVLTSGAKKGELCVLGPMGSRL